jgi:hypothetical protein
MHSFLTWDHERPAEFQTIVKADILSRYQTVEFRQSRIMTVQRLDNWTFEATQEDCKKTVGRKVVLAMGVTDVLPSIPAFRDLWRTST